MMAQERQKVLVAMSGGVDSSVAAYLLQKQGFEVIGLTFQLYDYSRLNRREGKGGCCSIEDVDDVRLVANTLGIRHYLVNSREFFRKKVIDYFVESYKKGSTPNPCVVCNTFVKFDELLYHADLLDISSVATGHYARLERSSSGDMQIHRAKDQDKDQSYFLVGVGRDKLQRIKFPCGDYSKSEIRKIAEEASLVTSHKKESMEICFITNNDYKSFLKKEYQVADKKGEVVDETGRVLGSHSGIHHFTVGQRKGLGALGLKAHYVVRIDADKNQVVVGGSQSLLCKEMLFESSALGERAKAYLGKNIDVKIRSRSNLVGFRITKVENNRIFGVFDEPQRSVTPGQFAVLYDGSELIGGGEILEALSEKGSSEDQKARSRHQEAS